MPLPPQAAAALARLEMFGMHLGLDHVRRLLAAVGDPQRGLPAVLVAGTNGKGSTAALLAAVGQAAGYRTGLYTSPHLETVEERVRLDGERVGGEELGALVLEVVAAGERVLPAPPTYFEALTAAALLCFRRHEVELAVLEVGLGGRLDATNAAEPAVSVITPVALEHQEQLGDTLAAIAGEKAGVMRRGRPTVAWGGQPEVAAALRAAAEASGAELVMLGAGDAGQPAGRPPPGGELERLDDGRPSASSASTLAASALPLPGAPWEGQRIVLATAAGAVELAVPLLGRHQAVNAALAWAAAERMARHGWPRLDAAAFRHGAARWRWPARLEPVSLPAGAPCRRVLLDAAHNLDGARALARFLADPPAPFPAPPVLLFGALDDKDAAAMLAALAPLAGRLVLTRPPHERGRDPRELLPLLPAGAQAEIEPDPAAALDRALALPGTAGADTLVVCGSIYLVGAARTALRRRFGVPAE
jgi:dihydrofolate synthase / folylpolyglutamate synthase